MEACGHYPWFERLLEELGIELWIRRCGEGASVGGAQAEDGSRATRNICVDLLRENRLPQHLGAASGSARRAAVAGASPQAGAGADADEEPAASHGVEPGRARRMPSCGRRRDSGVGAVALAAVCGTSGEGNCCNRSTDWKRRSANWTGGWRTEARQRPEAVRLMTHPGVGPVTALAMVLRPWDRPTDSNRPSKWAATSA